MVNQPGGRASAVERHLERVDDEFGSQIVSHRRAHDQPGERVLDVREVQEPFPGRDVGDVRRPRLVGVGGAEVALEQVGSDPDAREPDRCAPAFACHYSGDTSGSHQPLDALSPAADLVFQAQLGVKPCERRRCPVRGGVDLLDLLGQPRVTERPVRRRAALPVVKAGAVHLQRPAHHRHREARPSASISAKISPTACRFPGRKAAAFFRISRSIRNV